MAAADDFEALVALLAGRRIVALTGAGCSTESGIPDYRGVGRPPRTRPPIQHDAFVRHAHVRRRYWARAVLGWAQFGHVRPNAGHAALAALERAGILPGLVTQNVDGLHGAAGSGRVIELHGRLGEVGCLGCDHLEGRAATQARLLAANPGWLARVATVAPDGDADLDDAAVDAFEVVGCAACGGALAPRVVFFGGHVDAATVGAAAALVDDAEALLVVGSSLAVYSGFRFARRAAERGIPIGILNLGPTRADPLAAARLEARAAEALPRLAARLIASG